MAGYVGSDIELDGSETEAELRGPMLGAYGTWLSGPLYVGALVQAQFLSVDYEAPGIGLTAEPDTVSLGASVEAGYRFAFGPASSSLRCRFPTSALTATSRITP